MANFLFDQLRSVRDITLNVVEEVSDRQAIAIPEGFNNNILWNLGHIYLIQERFAFLLTQEPAQLPEEFSELFGRGTKPDDWKVQPPAMIELNQLLKEQPDRIRQRLENRLDETVANPHTTASGVVLKTIGELLSFSLYHEGMHVQTIKMLKKFTAAL